MAVQRDEPQVNGLEALDSPIEFLTENGFSIVRSWECDHKAPPTDGTYSFLVQNEAGRQREIIVTIADQIITDVTSRTKGRINGFSSFWISSAERHLADYLWRQEDYPAENTLVVEQLDPEEIIAALKWQA